jgi:hypothetical protein
MKSQKVDAAGECCVIMGMVLSRVRKQDKLGLTRFQSWDKATGNFSDRIVLRIRPGRGLDRASRATICSLNYCPFCGKQLAKRKKPAKKVANGLKNGSRSARRSKP